MRNRRNWAAIAAFVAAFALTAVYPPAFFLCLIVAIGYIILRILIRYGYDPNEDDDPLIH